MNGVQEVVGGVRVKPIALEIIKRCSGGMAAVSSAILLFAIHDGRSPDLNVLAMLSMHAFSIPCLIGTNIFYGLLSSYESISLRTDMLLDRLSSVGFGISLGGYSMLIWMFNGWLSLILLCGVAFAVYQMRGVIEEVDSPHMKRIS